MPSINTLEQLDAARFDTPAILKKLTISSRRLAELKGIAGSIPHQGILINTLNLYPRSMQLVGDKDPRQHEFTVQLRAFDAAKSGAKLGVASLVALCTSLFCVRRS